MKQKFDIEKKKKGFVAVNEGKTIFLPNAELLNIGCKNCVWQIHGQCPHNLKNDEVYERVTIKIENDFKDGDTITEKEFYSKEHTKTSQNVMKGICNELIQFVLSLAEKDDSASALWEKFHIYKARIQESEDYKDFLRLEREIKEKKGTMSAKELEQLKMNKTAAKMWWVRLNDQVVKSLSKIADRESKTKEGGKLPGIMSAKTINFNVNPKIEDKNKK